MPAWRRRARTGAAQARHAGVEALHAGIERSGCVRQTERLACRESEPRRECRGERPSRAAVHALRPAVRVQSCRRPRARRCLRPRPRRPWRGLGRRRPDRHRGSAKQPPTRHARTNAHHAQRAAARPSRRGVRRLNSVSPKRACTGEPPPLAHSTDHGHPDRRNVVSRDRPWWPADRSEATRSLVSA
jgi:hypothetical protein